MTRGKRIAIVLGVAAGVLALLAISQQAGVGRGYRTLAGGAPADVPQFTGLERESQKLAGFDQYGDILAQPVFNETREPEEVAATDATGEETAAAASPLNVALTGVIITPDVQIAFVRDNATNEVRRVKVGNPLEGEQSGWKLVELKPRGAVFEGEGLGKQEVELTTDTRGAAPTAAPPVVAAVADPNAPAPAPDPNAPPAQNAGLQPGEQTVAANADEIRRRIEDRRKQLRED
ncbi:MAG TPA: hypothetical protein VND91_10685, partial [Candidatus Saccharimonadia bacterium]|nr:hypothetical protein [Candidatus Saccharimonadia bacterium]